MMLDKKNINLNDYYFDGAINPEMCRAWAEYFLSNDAELQDEIDDIKGTISNENLWVKGSNKTDAASHINNVKNLESYLSWLESLS